MEKGPEWKLSRLRFTVAHELAHYFLHRELPQAAAFASLPDFARWTASYGGRKYSVEQEANEFAGRLLVPETRLASLFDGFAPEAGLLVPNFMQSESLRNAGTRQSVTAQASSRLRKNATVFVVEKNSFPAVPACHDVVKGTLKFNAYAASHG